MVGPVEPVPSRIWNRKDAHTTPEGKIYRSERQAEYFHQFADIFRESKVLTNDSKPTSDTDHIQRFQQLFPPPNTDYDSALQMGVDMTEHWSSKIEISDLCNTEEAFERVLKWLKGDFLTEFISEWLGHTCLPCKNRVSAFESLYRLTSGDGPRDILLFKIPNKRPSKHVSTLIQILRRWFWQKMVNLISYISLMMHIRTRLSLR